MRPCSSCFQLVPRARTPRCASGCPGRAGALEGWPARGKWRSLDWWAAAHGARCVPVELGAGGAWREAVLTLAELVDRHLAPSARGEPGAGVAYLAQHALLDQVRAAWTYPNPNLNLKPTQRPPCGELGAEVAYLAQHALLDQVRAARGCPKPCIHALAPVASKHMRGKAMRHAAA